MLKGYIIEDTPFAVNGSKVFCEDSYLLPSLEEIAWENYSPALHDITNENAIGEAIVELYKGKITHYSDLSRDDLSTQGFIMEDELDALF